MQPWTSSCTDRDAAIGPTSRACFTSQQVDCRCLFTRTPSYPYTFYCVHRTWLLLTPKGPRGYFSYQPSPAARNCTAQQRSSVSRLIGLRTALAGRSIALIMQRVTAVPYYASGAYLGLLLGYVLICVQIIQLVPGLGWLANALRVLLPEVRCCCCLPQQQQQP